MKSNWLLIAESESLTLTSRFYKISFGTTKQEIKDWTYISQYANKHGYYFEKWSEKVADFFSRIVDSLGCNMLEVNLPLCSAREFVKCLVNFGEPPKVSLIKPSWQNVTKLFRPSAYFNQQIRVLQHAEAKKRNKPKAYSDTPSLL